MRILVTGGAGFIGSHVADALLERGHAVDVIDNLSSGRRRNVPDGAHLHAVDIRSEDAAALIAERSYDVLVHHAAQMDVRRSVEAPGMDADVNIRGFLNLMEAGRRNGLQKAIVASSGGAIYGEPQYSPQDVDHPCHPLSPYGVAKLATEKYLNFYREAYGIVGISLRYANIYGPRQSAQGEGGVVAIFTRQMLTGEQPTINGGGEQTRDYVYVGDVVRANIAALMHDQSGTFNVGTGRETSVNDLFHIIEAQINADVDPMHGPPKPGEQERSVLGYAQTTDRLGWEPQITVEEGVARTVEWFRNARAPVDA